MSTPSTPRKKRFRKTRLSIHFDSKPSGGVRVHCVVSSPFEPDDAKKIAAVKIGMEFWEAVKKILPKLGAEERN